MTNAVQYVDRKRVLYHSQLGSTPDQQLLKVEQEVAWWSISSPLYVHISICSLFLNYNIGLRMDGWMDGRTDRQKDEWI